MFPSSSQIVDDVLVRYLLGSLPESEVERLDEWSVTDDVFAQRLKDAENDLLDDYAAGRLGDDVRARVEAIYLTSPAALERIRFARTLGEWEKRGAATATVGAPAEVKPKLIVIRRRWRWPLAAAAVLTLGTVAGYLAIEHTQAPVAHAPTQALQKTQAPEVAAGSAAIPVAATFLLLPGTRGTNALRTLTLPANAASVELRAQLEFDDFAQYRLELRDLAADRVVWRSDSVAAHDEGGKRVVAATIPVNTLQEKSYALQVLGTKRGAPDEPVGDYAFQMKLP